MRFMRGTVVAVLVGIVLTGWPLPRPAEARHIYDMYFPLSGDGYYFYKSFGACRDNCRRKHTGVDIVAPKLTPVVAVADGKVRYVGEGDECCTISIVHDDGYHSVYAHLNNDTPGTDDGRLIGYAPGIALGVHVSAGTLLGWVGDSSNSENTVSHLHFELRRPRGERGLPIDPYPSLRAAQLLDHPLRKVTTMCDLNGDGLWDKVVGDPGSDRDAVLDTGGVTVDYASADASSGIASASDGWQTSLTGASELDLLGASLACGDFNRDGYDDLAVGAPGVDGGRTRHAGAVYLYYGSETGLSADHQLLTPSGTHDDRFGSSLGALDRDGDGFFELVVGAPYARTRRSKNGGEVVVFRGTPSGLRSPEVILSPELSAKANLIRFGTTVLIEDRTGDGVSDIVIGAAGTEVGDPGGASFYVIPGATSTALAQDLS